MAQNKIVIYAAAGANLAIAATKLAASLFTGSSAMLTEAIHSFVDTGDQGLLLLGQARGRRPPDAMHPFGYGMEVYFWSFIVALMIFALGGGVSIYEGVQKVLLPQPIAKPWVNFLVLGLAFLFEAASLVVAYREFSKGQPTRRSVLTSIRRSKDPTVFAVLLEDSAALAGLVIAAAGLAAAELWDLPYADGVASILIGALLIIVAVFLATETRSLMVGEAASKDVREGICGLLADRPDLARTGDVLTMHLGPGDILVAVNLEFEQGSALTVRQGAADLVRSIKDLDQRIHRVFLSPMDSEPEPPPRRQGH
jgi:cation diffusion facilitator family transporter